MPSVVCGRPSTVVSFPVSPFVIVLNCKSGLEFQERNRQMIKTAERYQALMTTSD